MVTGDASTPPVIHHHCLVHWGVIEQPRQEVCGIPVLVKRLPVSVAPYHIRLVVVHLWMDSREEGQPRAKKKEKIKEKGPLECWLSNCSL
ncbi:hypothetical protein E2C01_028249 [Portunus trituberculatus]|uniref:Uncharacterized protein n=1 Tax=Portunus trituberculatus TaxID=210409 RepID=A0A5B7ENP2_PORTR|nr:hypothetical protein [Portunus trituberculatus]